MQPQRHTTDESGHEAREHEQQLRRPVRLCDLFSDGYTTQLATVTGDMTSGYAATLTVGIAA